jgi:hypothetical protein
MNPCPDYVTCIWKSDHPRHEHSSLCGRKGGFVFRDIGHARNNRKTEGRLVACPDCLRLLGEAEFAASEADLIDMADVEKENA